ncbi:hypothetical protein HYPSUDRAFT_205046 [Hypholoma sublateritium FD-334 SS-4]|uniref:Uncharacterized protein n=1 Tax=Hypholoma sublateritium (strain FD-334 SS-4) TaxID=945553 RepID=A0A0D2PF58_HYPSF|nr:hypothetical protein HYPSUDRAFT_205046 [Hypholoma sublateritium FD-334 SS-4]
MIDIPPQHRARACACPSISARAILAGRRTAVQGPVAAEPSADPRHGAREKRPRMRGEARCTAPTREMSFGGLPRGMAAETPPSNRSTHQRAAIITVGTGWAPGGACASREARRKRRCRCIYVHRCRLGEAMSAEAPVAAP